ncbi:hypothetical protein OROGR_032005 [Orobanche gracilis]
MKGMPLTFDFEGKGELDLELVVKNKIFFTENYLFQKNCFLNNNNNSFVEPTSVLDSARFPSRPTSSPTLSSSFGGVSAGGGAGASNDTAGVAAVSDANPSPKWQHDSTTATSSNAAVGADPDLLPVPPYLQIGNTASVPEKFAMEDWETVLSESVPVSPSQEQSFFRWIMGDVEDPSVGSLNKSIQIGCGGSTAPELEFSGGYASNVDQGFGAGECFMPALPNFPNNSRSEKNIDVASNPVSSDFSISQNIMHNPSSPFNNLGAVAFDSSAVIKPPIFNPQLLINQHQAHHSQNPSFFLPSSYPQHHEQNTFGPPLAKRHNPAKGGFQPVGPTSKGPFIDTGQPQELLMGRQNLHPNHHHHHQQQAIPHHLQLLPHFLGPAGPRPKMEELGYSHQLQLAIVDQIYKAAELVQTGNPVLAQGILARLNHHLSPIGKPFQRAAFYCKEALLLLLDNTNSNNTSSLNSSPFSLVFKIGAYKSFSEISPLIQFANFTCNQAILEVLEGLDQIHIVDFDIGLGGQWASLMQELALKNGGPSGPPSLRITAVASLSTHDQLELVLTRENLIQFADEVNIPFEFEATSIDSLNCGSRFHALESEAVVVNLPVGCLANNQLPAPFILRFVKQLSPRIVVSVDRGCDRTDMPFANHIIHVLQSNSNLLESLDAVNVDTDALQKIERFLLLPGIEKIVAGRFEAPEKTQHWRSLFLSSGFSPVIFSNFTESQAECIVKRTPVRGFQVEKRQSSLVLCWQRKELISASAWRC